MKKLIIFLTIIFISIFSYIFLFKRSRNYKINYKIDDFDIVESFDKNNNIYNFKILYNNNSYDYIYIHKYNTKRKIVNKVIISDNDCVSLSIGDFTTKSICYNNGYYFEDINDSTNEDIVKKVNNINIYNEKFDYYIWNGYGITSVLDNKEFNFINNETYDNDLYYQYDKYIIFADYDSNRTFSKFYIFNKDTNKISEFQFDYDISFDSYFLGNIDDYIYLFDTKSKVEYKINIIKEKILIVNDENGGPFFDKTLTTRSINELTYKKELFNYNRNYNYSVIDNKIYLNYYNSNFKIKISNLDVDYLLYCDNENVYYLSGNTVYRYNYNDGEEKLINYFEWNFSYKGKIFIFNN